MQVKLISITQPYIEDNSDLREAVLQSKTNPEDLIAYCALSLIHI